mmetsp:Transcript_9215/g.17291  ORF Transcript_9215/g.17291 Transcript_9215/m.17291 type:complete len:450 (-) Transcript_9215:577-1926(-)|eukprot:CAMPEP_0175064452 /NCGR_PEP_ID=MMETSP0052_2-20121109/15340_1 /TAXON_ID=51329 ORGANISM="Polytomella parva, Strain SAG 63-3" /NCGR_SAMPLE_ID=MMETSP0052_2 /ASSEMBLY_ACC=CAM_ASM_000194 /LENGTH=449 /DNA_ID=CAMNT_0016330803 /DNA_START=54 /DNA_END=1403 /DNA_ORIENTATION=+
MFIRSCLWAIVCLFICASLANAKIVTVDGDSVVDKLTKLAKYTADPNPAVTRVLFTPEDMQARSYVKELMREAGLSIREDAMGSIYGRWEGSDSNLGSVLTGSHCDAIPLAGMYDGTLGVIGGIEALAALKRSGFQPLRSLEVMMFTSEEPTRFGLSCSSSRAMAGILTVAELESKLDKDGRHFVQVARDVGYGANSTQAMLEAAKVHPGAIDFFVELHIEQGPILEKENLNIGIVSAIAAPSALSIELTGDGGHAGGQLMPDRNDAGLAGSEIALKVEEHVLATGSIDTVGTTGLFEVRPGAVNSVPRDVRIGIDIRDIDGPRRDDVVGKVLDSAAAIAAKRKVRIQSHVINQDPPATCAAAIISAAERSAAALGLSSKKMVSRAYHDSLFMARIAPTGMIFIPCRNGWSHRPDEFSSATDIANGVSVLAMTMADLSGGSFAGDRTEL